MTQNPFAEPQNFPAHGPVYNTPTPAQPPVPAPTAGVGYAMNPSFPGSGIAPYGQSMNAPFGIEPITGIPYSDKSKLVAGLLQIFLGTLGVGRFYLGNVGMGIAQILATVVTFGIGALWPLIDGIVLLAGSPRDTFGRPLRP